MKLKKTVLGISVIVTLVSVGFSVASRERLLKNGKTVLFELAPVDPRSIMQGDYMTLSYRITNAHGDSIPSRGYIVFKADCQNVASRSIRFQKNKEPLSEDEMIIRYFCHKRVISIGSESFFFQEGEAGLYARAKYGGIKVSKDGESILYGLFDENCNEIDNNSAR